MPRRKPASEPAKPPRRAKGTGTITVLKNGSIRARLPASIDPKRKAKEFRPGQMAQAVAWLDSFLYPTPALPSATMTVGEWTGHWHSTYIEPMHPDTTARRILHSLKKLAPIYATLITDVRPSGLQAILGPLAGRLAAETLRGIAGDWRRCFEAAVDDELLLRNPARRLSTPRPVPKEAKRHVSPEEVRLLWPAIRSERFEVAYALLLGCGLRIGEVLGLHWSNVDLNNRRAWIQHQWVDSQMRDLPKGRNPHWVTLPTRVVAALIRHHNDQPEGALLVMQSPNVNHHGHKKRGKRAEPRPWSAQSVRHDLLGIIKRLEMDPLTPHAFRRGLVTALLDGGASPAVTADRVGHRNTATTLNHYGQVSRGANDLANEIVEAYLGGSAENDSGNDLTA